MFESIDANKIVSTVELKKGYDSDKTCLLVEGCFDRSVYRKFTSEDHCAIVICYGKCNMVPAIESLNESDIVDGYVAIKDADFDFFENRLPPPNLLLTDGHDLEVMMMSSSALDDIIDVRLAGETDEDIVMMREILKERLLSVGSLIGYFRLKSRLCGWGIDIETGRFLPHLSSDCFLLLNVAIDELKARYPEIDETEMSLQEFEELKSSSAQHLCCGHDMIFLLAQLFSRLTKRYLHKKINPGSDLDERLSLAFNEERFQSTNLYGKIKDWEQENSCFTFLTV